MTMSKQESGRIGGLKTSKFQHDQKNYRIEKYNLNPIYCKYCSKILLYEKRNNKYCNHSCAASATNLGVIRNITTGERSKKECLYCQEITTNLKYCSHQCNKKHNWEKRKKEIEETGIIPERRVGIRYLKEMRENKCEICDLKEWNNKYITMIMDHIDGNSENNTILNLRLICPNCDSQLSTYKNKNKGNGRYTRRQRYADSKSY